MIAAPLPADTDILKLKNRLYDEHRIEVPLVEWFPLPLTGEGANSSVYPFKDTTQNKTWINYAMLCLYYSDE